MSTAATEAQPSTSKADLTANSDDYELVLDIKNEEAEIARLQLPNTDTAIKEETPAAVDDERIAKIKFHCVGCNMHEMVHYFGKAPPFVYGLEFLEDSYVMRDPFQPPPPRWKPKAEYFIALGANCVHCKRCVCKDAECSFYYTATFCLRCAEQRAHTFPLEVQSKLRKQLAATNNKD